jgi:hypothetical protein
MPTLTERRNNNYKQRLLDQAVALAHARVCLNYLRSGKFQEAISNLELFLDSLVSPLARGLEDCDAATEVLLIEELKGAAKYRSENPQAIGGDLDGLDDVTRDGLVEMRKNVERVLGAMK